MNAATKYRKVSGPPKDIYAEVTAKILDALAAGTVPWHQPWTINAPRNLASKKAYRGINVLLLGISPFTSLWWGTYAQIEARGGRVRKGEKGTMIVFWRQIVVDDKSGAVDEVGNPQKKNIPLLRYYTVFNAEQADNLDVPVLDNDNVEGVNPLEECEEIVSTYLQSGGPSFIHSGNSAYYRPSSDTVNVPPTRTFHSTAGYYSTVFHELTHSTGAEKRLNRDGVVKSITFGSDLYSAEELVAELGAAFLCGAAGVEVDSQFAQSAAYIASWAKALKNDNHLIVTAAGKAQKAVDLILGVTFNNNNNEKEG